MDKIINKDNIVVSICCLVYNHENFIRQCLDGFLMQKVDFPIEILIHDDASTDKSADIIREYEEKYPEIIKPIYQKENQYSKGVKVSATFQYSRAKGKYIALCEGDDYWTDPYKLQKQVDFLESHSDFSLCFHNAVVHYEDSEKDDRPFASFETGEYLRSDLLKFWINPTASFVFRKEILATYLYKRVLQSKKLIAGDLPLVLTASYNGRLYGMKEFMSVYRIHSGGVMSNWCDKSYQLCLHTIEMDRIFESDIHILLQQKIGDFAGTSMDLFICKRFKKGFNLWILAFTHAPLIVLRKTFGWIYRKILVYLGK